MIKRPMLGMFLMMAAGVLLGRQGSRLMLPLLWENAGKGGGTVIAWGILPALAATLFVILLMMAGVYRSRFRKRRIVGRTRVICLLLLGAVLGLFRGSQYEIRYQRTRQALETAGKEACRIYAAGLITQTRQTETSTVYQLSHCTLEMQGASGSIPDLTIFQKEKTEYAVGDYITLYGIPTALSTATNDGGYDERSACYEKGIAGKFLTPKIKKTDTPTNLILWGKMVAGLDHLVQSYREIYELELSAENRGILEAMCLGKKEHLLQEQKDSFKNAGISHLLAISGVHVCVVGMFLFRRIRKFRIPMGAACIFTMIISFFFAVSTGSGISALRAVVMFGVFLGSIFWGKSYDGFSAMAFAGILLLLTEPYCIAGASFQYSFAAVTGIFGVQELIRVKYQKLHPILSSLLVSTAAWLTTLPLTAWYQYRITTFSALLNLVIIPLASPVLVGGLFGGGLKLMGTCLEVFHNLPIGYLSRGIACILSLAGKGFLKMAEFCILLLRGLAEGYGRLPGGNLLVGKPHWGICLIFYVILFICYYIGKKKKYFLYFSGIIPLIAIMAVWNQSYENRVVFLDVGQGDGIYLESADGKSFFIDGGSSSESQIGRYTLQPFLEYHARDSVDVWFVSHCDTDHVSGLLELLEYGYPIGRIVFAADVAKDKNYNRIKENAKQRDIKVSHMKDGDYIQTEEVRFLSLGGEQGGEPVALDGNSNDRCLVLLARFLKTGQTCLFAGDSSSDAEQEFLPALQEQLSGQPLFLMKANHHGSKNSNGELLLQTAKPKLAVISCSLTNSYGHPHPEAVKRLEQAGAKVLYTMKSGQVTIRMKEEAAWVEEVNSLYFKSRVW
ncbi:MAG: DNA internalization-related competence protein ComEC/Rec2 [Lachnospiraceae bacterium]